MSVEFARASAVNTGGFCPEKNASCNERPAAYVTIHCVSSEPHRLFRCRNFFEPGTINRYRLPFPPAVPSASKRALASACSRPRIRAMVKLTRLMEIFSSARATSPVMDFAVELVARQYPLSCAAAVMQQTSTNPTTALSNVSRFIYRALHFTHRLINWQYHQHLRATTHALTRCKTAQDSHFSPSCLTIEVWP
jgi:hypothetical protein